ncbi:MAG: hypothetical protein OK456_06130 [Thaumarchaeota archaeon]|nr:hypothetical protein [Nitrososphaerota archaeon]
MKTELEASRADIDWNLSNLNHLLGASRICLLEGGNWLASRIYPGGPILHEKDLNYIYKGVWGLHAAGVHPSVLDGCFRWIETALKPNGDLYFDEESEYHRNELRGYRLFTIMKVAGWVGDPLARNPTILSRLMEYQAPSGGVYDYIGERAGKVEMPLTRFTTLNTPFFGHAMLALGKKEAALAAGTWLSRFVESNIPHMRKEGVMYTAAHIDGSLNTKVDPDSILGRVNLVDAKQEFWQVGVVMSYLTLLYDVARSRWNMEEEAEPFLKMALELNEFESRMPLYTYLYPSKCKVAWGSGELLRVLSKYGLGTHDQIEKALAATRNTLVITFMDNQLPNGGWAGEHYVTSKKDPEYQFEYKPLKGTVNVPTQPLPGSNLSFITGEEIAGEFLGEIKAAEQGLIARIDSLTNGD